MEVGLPLLHAGAEALALLFAQVGPTRAEVAVHAALPAVSHAFVHVRAPTRAAREEGDADGDEKQGPEQVEQCGIDEAIVLEQAENADGDEGERENAHGSLQGTAARVR